MLGRKGNLIGREEIRRARGCGKRFDPGAKLVGESLESRRERARHELVRAVTPPTVLTHGPPSSRRELFSGAQRGGQIPPRGGGTTRQRGGWCLKFITHSG